MLFMLFSVTGLRLGKIKQLLVHASTAAAASSPSKELARPFRIRMAERSDVIMIHQCNNRFLPEKYTLDFLFKHYEGFPSLAYIAEDENSNLVGYAIGRVKLANELRRTVPTNAAFLGHISSICVTPEFRGQGIARSLMENLHKQFLDTPYAVRTVTLHCRCSNEAAINLYSKSFGYRCAERIKQYYEDGEDAFFMVADDLKLVKQCDALASEKSNAA